MLTRLMIALVIALALALGLALATGAGPSPATPPRPLPVALAAARELLLLPDGRVEITEGGVRRVFRWDGERWLEMESLPGTEDRTSPPSTRDRRP